MVKAYLKLHNGKPGYPVRCLLWVEALLLHGRLLVFHRQKTLEEDGATFELKPPVDSLEAQLRLEAMRALFRILRKRCLSLRVWHAIMALSPGLVTSLFSSRREKLRRLWMLSRPLLTR